MILTRVMPGLAALAALGLVLGSLSCADSCETQAEAACKQFFNEGVGDGTKYDSCYLQSLAECGHSG